MPYSASFVKNISKRVLWTALEKDISKEARNKLAKYFGQRCAYCGKELPKQWHADHLLPVDKGGFNHTSNRVPACPPCNGNEKRDMNWEEFLHKKSGSDTALFNFRKNRIESWRIDNLAKEPPVSQAERNVWDKEVKRVVSAIDEAVKNLKRAKTKCEP